MYEYFSNMICRGGVTFVPGFLFYTMLRCVALFNACTIIQQSNEYLNRTAFLLCGLFINSFILFTCCSIKILIGSDFSFTVFSLTGMR